MNKILRQTFFIFFTICSSISLPAQSALHDYFSAYSEGQPRLWDQSSKKSSDNIKWVIAFGPLKGETVVLYENDLLPQEHIVNSTTQKNLRLDLPKTYSGYLVSDPSKSKVRLTVSNQHLLGSIEIGKKNYFIEPVSNFTELKSNAHVWYDSDHAISTKETSCASREVAKRSQESHNRITKSEECRVYDVAIALDYGYNVKHGGIEGALAQSISIMNMVAGDFDDAFDQEIQFRIVEHYISDCSSCDPWELDDHALVFLNHFASWASTGFSSNYDIGQFWTTTNLWYGFNPLGYPDYGVIGFAENNVCDGAHQIMEDYTSHAPFLRTLTSHEFGHNFGYDHDPDRSGYIMTPSVTDTRNWSFNSKNSINQILPSLSCYSNCLGEGCDETYTLTQPVLESHIAAHQSIISSSEIIINNNLNLSAPNIELGANFTVEKNATLTTDTEGCN